MHRGVSVEQTVWVYQELNQCQMYDVIRAENVARLAMVTSNAPYLTPMHYQWQMDGDTSIFHFAGAAHGRRFEALCANKRVALEIEHRHCTGMDVILAEGAVEMHVSEEEDAAWIEVTIHRMTGRRYFIS